MLVFVGVTIIWMLNRTLCNVAIQYLREVYRESILSVFDYCRVKKSSWNYTIQPCWYLSFCWTMSIDRNIWVNVIVVLSVCMCVLLSVTCFVLLPVLLLKWIKFSQWMNTNFVISEQWNAWKTHSLSETNRQWQ
jgi:hypothetical protein